MFTKPGKPPDDPASFRPISLLPFFSKICEKLIHKRLSSHITLNNVLPHSQFGFRCKHSTIHQVHRMVDTISSSLEKKQYCTSVFLDMSQAFDRVWHQGLLFKLRKYLPSALFLLIKSYLDYRHFQIRFGTAFSNIAAINAGVPQGGILSPILFNIFVSDQPTLADTLVADYADDKAIMSMHVNPDIASATLQLHLDLMADWYKKWRVKINSTKSVHITFTLKLGHCPNVSINNTQIPTSDAVKYLGLHLDKRLTWNNHIKTKRLLLNSRSRILKSLYSNQFTNLKTKIIIYKSLLKPIWTYGLQLWGAAKKSNTNKIQTFQNITLRKITNAPYFVSNHTLHNDLHIKTINEEAKTFYNKFHLKLSNHYIHS
uniref:Putative RNA-directed DNA polymerase n=1 Tax=Sipha flava TaxID=143950 RepID=A0A2S2Q1W5_9HEMI